MKYLPDIANLSSDQMKRLRSMEEELGVVLVAFEKIPVFAELNDDSILEMKKLEQKLGIRLIALK